MIDIEDREAYQQMLRDAIAMPPSDKRRRELARLCRVGVYHPKPEDWPEFDEEAWRDGVFYLQGKARGLAVGQQVCADPENIARVYEIIALEEKQVEGDDYEETGELEWRTKLHVKAIAINGSYDVIPGWKTENLDRRIIWARSNAECAIRRNY